LSFVLVEVTNSWDWPGVPDPNATLTTRESDIFDADKEEDNCNDEAADDASFRVVQKSNALCNDVGLLRCVPSHRVDVDSSISDNVLHEG